MEGMSLETIKCFFIVGNVTHLRYGRKDIHEDIQRDF